MATLAILGILTGTAIAHDGSPGEPAAQAAVEQTIGRIAQLLDAQDLAAAKAATDEGLRAYPSSAALHNFAGVIDAQQGAFASAESHFQTAIKLAPRSPGAYENLGRLYQERSGVDPEARGKALRIYQALVAIDPTNTEGLYQLAFLQALAGQFAESRALARSPSSRCARPAAGPGRAGRGPRRPAGSGSGRPPRRRSSRIPS